MMPKESAVSVGIVFMLVLGTLAVFAPEKTVGVIGTTLYVRGSGPGNYTTIQEALDRAEPGDTITVYEGTYYENLVITTAVTLKGTGTNTVIIDGNGLGDGVLVTSDHVTLENMTIQGGGTNFAGITLQASHTTVTTCHIQDNLFGVYCLNQGNNTFQGCTLTDNNEGFLLDTSPNNTITHCTMTDNKDGLWLDSTSNHNTITHCTFTGNEQGMLLWGLSNYNLISECTFTGNAIGIRLLDAKWNTFILNTFTENENHTESVISDNFWYSQEKINYSFNGETRWGFVGNYWDDYPGSDDDGDGIGDIPYEIDADDDDNYPLTTPYNLPLNQPPIVILSASPTSGLAPLTVTFTISASDPDGSISSWALDIDNDGNKEYSGIGRPPSTKQFNYTSYGSYTAKLTVIDNRGATDSDTAIVTVSQTPPQNKAPTAVFIYSLDGHTVNFTDISTDPDGNVTSWYWDFGDQNFSNTSNPTHEYKEEGDYIVNLTVTDDDNETDSFIQTIKVENSEEDEGDDGMGIPGFEGALSVVALISLVIILHSYKEKKRKKGRNRE